jgi:hypothetical protein
VESGEQSQLEDELFYAKDKPSIGQGFGLDEFRPTNILRPRASWVHELTKEEMKIT